MNRPTPLKILNVSDLYPPAVRGGFELTCARASARWAAQGHWVSVLTSTTDGRVGADGLDGVAVLRHLSPASDLGPGYRRRDAIATLRGMRAALSVRAATAALRPDVVVAWGVNGIPAGALAAAMRGGRKAMVMAYDFGVLDQVRGQQVRRRRGSWHDALAAARRLTGSDLDAIPPAQWVFCSHALRRRYEAQLGPLPGTVIHHGVRLSPEPATVRRGARPLLVGAAGRIVPEKGFHTLVAAAHALAAGGRYDVRVEVRGAVSEGEYQRRLRAAVEAANDAGADVVILPPLGHTTYTDWLASRDVVVVPSEWEEPLALVPLEAMAAARPVVGTPVGGMVELYRDGENALVFPPGDSAALAAILGRLADDDELAGRIGAAGRQTVALEYRQEDADAALDGALERAAGG